jgi:two-component system cell cycle sensor histidine kinase/response regulator CckA
MFRKKKKQTNPHLVNIVEELKDGFCTTDLEGNFLYRNQAALEIFDLKDNNDRNFYHNIIRDEAQIKRIRNYLVKQDYIKDLEIDLYTISNKKFPALLSINLIKDPSQKAIGMSLLIKDMTYIKKVQHQLLQAQKMESIGMLVSGIAHEFNNILTGIIPNAELIKITSSDDDPNFLRAQSIQKSALRASEIVKKLLSFARNNKIEENGVSNFLQVATETIDIIYQLFDKSIQIETCFQKDLYHVNLDATQLQQIIMNLSLNAKDAISGQGKIVFKAENYHIKSNESNQDHLPEGDYVLFQVSDTGHGIEERNISKIFDPFFSTKETGKGSGLGLSIVYGIVNRIRGKIEVKSTLNEGTTFKIFFPATNQYQHPQLEEYHLKRVGAGYTILVIDDEKMIRDMSCDILFALGYKVLLAPNGSEGIRIYKQHKNEISVVILDLIMPKMNGMTCYEKLKRINPQVKVIVTSGISETKQRNDLEKMGINAYIVKPFSLQNIAETIEKVTH